MMTGLPEEKAGRLYGSFPQINMAMPRKKMDTATVMISRVMSGAFWEG